MKKLECLKMLSLLLASSLIFGNNIKIYADTNAANSDFNNDGIVDTQDLAILTANYNLKSGDKNWNLKYD